ncbi:MAG: PKD domain-containing protein, partial [Bacteroidia bacterium]|nr:PKD domain-containing protein [Bacteroidia bacterium]
MRKYLLILLFWIPILLQAQNCKISTATTKVCLGNTLLFNVSFDAGYTASSYSWNFGNAASSSQGNPVYQYPARGKFVPSVTINFTNSTSCTVSGDTIQVVDNPVSNFSVTTALTQCFKNNQTCMNDLSVPGADNAPIDSRLFLYGDGGFSNAAPGTGNLICHNYTNPLGGVYTLVLEVTDANNCVSRKERTDYITVFSKMQEVSFRTNYVTQCNTTPSLYTNTSKIPQSQVKSYKWDFGDGNVASSPWTGFTHNYTTSGIFMAKLFVEDINGCRDTAVVYPAAENYVIDSTIYLKQTTSCYYHNGFTVHSNNNYGPASQIFWAYYKVGSPTRVDTSIAIYTDSINFPDCGEFQIRMYVKIGNCFLRRDTTVKVFGPKSLIEKLEDPIINSIQCEVHDTVLFRTPVGDHSCFYNNGALLRIWDFDDDFAPPCTTDTKLGLNIGLNCRYSKDSANVKHAYKPGEDKCYFPKLILTDIVSGCTDTSTAAMKLTQPDAGWDSLSTPIRRGLYHLKTHPCLDQSIEFFLDETLPLCGRQKVWFMPDSLCPGAQWIPQDSLAIYFTHTYTTTCDPNGYVTTGLIIKNGKDKNGNDCYDTAWY